MLRTDFLTLSKPLPGKPNGFRTDPYLDVIKMKKGKDDIPEVGERWNSDSFMFPSSQRGRPL